MAKAVPDFFDQTNQVTDSGSLVKALSSSALVRKPLGVSESLECWRLLMHHMVGESPGKHEQPAKSAFELM